MHQEAAAAVSAGSAWPVAITARWGWRGLRLSHRRWKLSHSLRRTWRGWCRQWRVQAAAAGAGRECSWVRRHAAPLTRHGDRANQGLSHQAHRPRRRLRRGWCGVRRAGGARAGPAQGLLRPSGSDASERGAQDGSRAGGADGATPGQPYGDGGGGGRPHVPAPADLVALGGAAASALRPAAAAAAAAGRRARRPSAPPSLCPRHHFCTATACPQLLGGWAAD
jgi:hypothetical protein